MDEQTSPPTIDPKLVDDDVLIASLKATIDVLLSKANCSIVPKVEISPQGFVFQMNIVKNQPLNGNGKKE